jgi:hypothetical protein
MGRQIDARNAMRVRRAEVLISVSNRVPEFARRLRVTRAFAVREVMKLQGARVQSTYTTRSNRLAEESKHYMASHNVL